jgi:hypothetical protein
VRNQISYEIARLKKNQSNGIPGLMVFLTEIIAMTQSIWHENRNRITTVICLVGAYIRTTETSKWIVTVKDSNKVLARLFLAVIFLGLIQVANAQVNNRPTSGAVISVNVSASIQASIELTTISNINFGQVTPGMTELYINPRQDGGAGLMRITGQPDMLIRVSFLERRELINTSGGLPLLFVYDISGAQTEDQFLSERLTAENREISLGPEGEFYFWIGGRLDLTNVSFGQYEGEFTLEIDYI